MLIFFTGHVVNLIALIFFFLLQIIVLASECNNLHLFVLIYGIQFAVCYCHDLVILLCTKNFLKFMAQENKLKLPVI